MDIHRPVLSGLAALLLQASTAAGVAEDLPEGTTFFDDFDALDTSFWGISDGWVNGSWQNCEWSNAALSTGGGMLKLWFSKTRTDKRDYICGEIQSQKTFGYGTYEARFITQGGSGLNAAFFTYIGPHHDKPHDEIDFEVLLRDPRRVSVNTYVSASPANGKSVPLPFRADTDFITYSFTWHPGGIDWYVDGELVHQTEPGTDLPVNRQKIYASFWGSDEFPNWMGEFEEPPRDLVMQIDWIAFTELGQGCQFPASILCALE